MTFARLKPLIVPGIIGVLLGFAVTLQLRSFSQTKTEVGTRVSEEMVGRFVRVTKEIDRLRQDLQRLQQVADNHATQEALREEILEESLSAGLVAVKGDGVSVTLAPLGDAANMTDSYSPQVKDVLLVVNELKASGADAIAVNGVRWTDRTVVSRPQGPSGPMMVNSRPIDGPVVITAIGDPNILLPGLKMYGGVVDQLMPWIMVHVAESRSLTIPAVATLPTYKYAVPQNR